LYFKNKEIQDVQAYYRKKIREADLRNDEEEVSKLEKKAVERINILADKFVEYEELSKIPERLKRKKQKPQ
jgi:biopolymer transport protein ExbD